MRVIQFDDAQLVPGIVNNTWFLIVRGTKPYLNMKVDLVPLIYIQKPEHWGIEVVGCLPGGIGLPATAAYEAFLDVSQLMGHKGIEVIGANKREKVGVSAGGSL